MTPDRTLEKLAEGVRLAELAATTGAERAFIAHWNPEFVLEVAREVERLRRVEEVLVDHVAMTEQSIGTLREWHEHWETLIEERDADGNGPLIENVLYWLIEDLSTEDARAALANPAAEESDHD